MLGMPSSNIRPPRVDYMGTNLPGPPLSTGAVQAGMPPPPGNLVGTVTIALLIMIDILGLVSSAGTSSFSGVPHQQPMGEYQQRFPPPPQSSAPPLPPPSGGA